MFEYSGSHSKCYVITEHIILQADFLQTSPNVEDSSQMEAFKLSDTEGIYI